MGDVRHGNMYCMTSFTLIIRPTKLIYDNTSQKVIASEWGVENFLEGHISKYPEVMKRFNILFGVVVTLMLTNMKTYQTEQLKSVGFIICKSDLNIFFKKYCFHWR